MNGSRRSNIRLVQDLVKALRSAETDVYANGNAPQIVICPPFVYLTEVADTLRANSAPGLVLGAQTLSEFDEGAFTGEVSAFMLVDLGCEYVLVGHSERRTVLGETNAQVAEKYHAALAASLVPVLCVGETRQQRDDGTTFAVIEEQLDAVVAKVGFDKLSSAVVAYEPIWAIGTGNTATAEQAQKVHAHIRKCLSKAGDNTRLLYGGSVNANNTAELMAQADIDGILVGGASLDAEQFAAICRHAVAAENVLQR